MTIDEGALKTFFNNKRDYQVAKLFMEGQGYCVENKHKDPRVRWEGLPIIVSSNSLPPILEQYNENSIN